MPSWLHYPEIILDEDGLALQVYEKQKRNQWQGLALETRQIIEDCNIYKHNKANFKKIINLACHEMNEVNPDLQNGSWDPGSSLSLQPSPPPPKKTHPFWVLWRLLVEGRIPNIGLR